MLHSITEMNELGQFGKVCVYNVQLPLYASVDPNSVLFMGPQTSRKMPRGHPSLIKLPFQLSSEIGAAV